MLRRVAVALLLAAGTGASWLFGRYYPTADVTRTFQTLLAITVIYVVGKLVVETVGMQRIQEAKTRYVFRKATSVLSLAAAAVVVLGIWVPDPTALLVAYGVIGAGVAIALQDFFKNFVGGITLFFGRIYQVGDRVELQDVKGDVIDIGLLYTRILEIEEWVAGDQATGRIVSIPNGTVLSEAAYNYTADNSFIWDEIAIPLTYDSDIDAARDILADIAGEVTADEADIAKEELSHIRQRYYLSERETGPRVFTELTDNWVFLHLRYITDARRRRPTHNTLMERFQDRVRDRDDIEIASETIDIVSFPGTED